MSIWYHNNYAWASNLTPIMWNKMLFAPVTMTSWFELVISRCFALYIYTPLSEEILYINGPLTMTLTPRAKALQDKYEQRLDPVALTSNPDPSQNTSSGVDYEPHPEKSIPISDSQDAIVKAICRLYSGSASEEDMQVYAEESVYDDPWSFCDTRYKIAGQWYGM